MIVFVLNFRQ